MNVASLLPSMYKHPPHFSCNQTGFSPHMRANVPPRSPIIALDVTVRFNDAASTLKTGELVKQDGFTLFEAVSALEVRSDCAKIPAQLICFLGAGSEDGSRFR